MQAVGQRARTGAPGSSRRRGRGPRTAQTRRAARRPCRAARRSRRRCPCTWRTRRARSPRRSPTRVRHRAAQSRARAAAAAAAAWAPWPKTQTGAAAQTAEPAARAARARTPVEKKTSNLWRRGVGKGCVCACAGLRMRFYLVVRVLDVAVQRGRALPAHGKARRGGERSSRGDLLRATSHRSRKSRHESCAQPWLGHSVKPSSCGKEGECSGERVSKRRFLRL